MIIDEQRYEVSGPALDFLTGGGEVGRHLRAHDWSASRLGLPETWPLTLRAAVKLLLTARSPIAVGWGPELLALYNDAYADILGPAGPLRFGLPFRDLSPEVWQRAEPLIEGALQRGESAMLEHQLFCVYRNGHAEETYLNLSCNPMAAHTANGQGVIVEVAEMTDHVTGARRTAALREVAACAAAARSVESACRDALDAISRHSTDIPFALLYVVRSGERTSARLVGTAALAPGTPASPAILSLDSLSDAAIWPVREALETNRTVVVDDLPARFEPLPSGGWPLAPRCAVVVPLTTPGRDQPDGVLIAGVSARHQLDTGNLDFIDLIAKHVVAGIAGGRLREEQERDALARAGAKRARAKQRARLKALEARFAGVLEERTRLAREIHDTLIQGLTGIALQLRAAVLQAEASSDDSLATLDRIADLAEKTSREARRVVWDMRPSVLSEREFVQAVESAAHRTMAGAGLVLHLTANGRGRSFPADGQAAVLRIVQEAIANVVRHAAANTIRLTMSFGVRRLRVTVVDDGRGFVVEPDFRAYGGHWGLVGMQERAEQIGASLRVRSAPGHGTTVVLSVPLPEPGAIRPRRQVES